MTALDDRRQNAREAGWDAIVDVGAREALEVAIETATRVQITDEIVERMRVAVDSWTWREDTEALARAAFEAAGFEVVE